MKTGWKSAMHEHIPCQDAGKKTEYVAFFHIRTDAGY